jgi:hypothetical protein
MLLKLFKRILFRNYKLYLEVNKRDGSEPTTHFFASVDEVMNSAMTLLGGLKDSGGHNMDGTINHYVK